MYEKFEESNLAENESTNRLPQDHFAKIGEKFGPTDLSMNNTIVSNSLQDVVNNCEQTQSKDSKTYLHQLDKNTVTFLPRDREPSAESEIQSNENILKSNDSDIPRGISREIYKESSISNVRNLLNIETNLQTYNSNEVSTDQKFLSRQMSKENISKNRKCNKPLSDNDNQLYIGLSNSGLLKFDESRYCNNISLASVNVSHVSKSHYYKNIATNEIMCTSDDMQNPKNLLHNEENLENFSSTCNIVSNSEEPMLRLVQTETGEQFYEFIISNLVEKMQNASSKDLEDTIENPSSIFRDNQKINSNSKESEKNDQIEHQQALDGLVDINSEFNYTQFDFHREEKNCPVLQSHSGSEHFEQNSRNNDCISNMQEKNMQVYNFGNLELLENESHVDFDKYVETNFEAFERLNYESCNERFLEFVEVADIGIESSGYKELSMVCLIQNDSEQLFQDSQTEQEANRDFVQANNFKDCSNILQDSNKIIEYPKNKSDLSTYIENNVPLTANNNRDIENIEGCTDSDNHLPTDVTTAESANNKNCTKTSEKLKKSKTISKKFQCSVCKKTFSTAYNYKQHIGIHFTDQQKFHCKDCGVSFAWKSTLNKHIANNHSSDGPQKFICEICSKVYSTLSQVNVSLSVYKYHILSYIVIKNFVNYSHY